MMEDCLRMLKLSFGRAYTPLQLTCSGEELFLWDVNKCHIVVRARSEQPSTVGQDENGEAAPLPERWQPGYVFSVSALKPVP